MLLFDYASALCHHYCGCHSPRLVPHHSTWTRLLHSIASFFHQEKSTHPPRLPSQNLPAVSSLKPCTLIARHHTKTGNKNQFNSVVPTLFLFSTIIYPRSKRPGSPKLPENYTLCGVVNAAKIDIYRLVSRRLYQLQITQYSPDFGSKIRHDFHFLSHRSEITRFPPPASFAPPLTPPPLKKYRKPNTS